MKIVIFCGGYGTRMWPASRKSYPKQFFPIVNGKSFFQLTVERFKKHVEYKDIFVSTEEKYTHFIHEQEPNIPKINIIAEPERRDNLAAVGLVTALIEKQFPHEVMFFSWSDHFIQDEAHFLKAVQTAAKFTQRYGTPVSINQEPTFPTVHNGWVKMGKKKVSDKDMSLYEIDKFVEKPNIHTARKLFRSGKYLVHTGYGAWRSDVLLGYFKKFTPETHAVLEKIASAWSTSHFEDVLKSEYHKIEKNSIDYGLFEKIPAHERLTMSIDVGWQDAGTWQLYYESLVSKASDNLLEGGIKATFIESEGNLVFGPKGKMVGIVGLSNLCVIDTPTGLLICPLDKTAKVKEIFSQLEKDYPEFVE